MGLICCKPKQRTPLVVPQIAHEGVLGRRDREDTTPLDRHDMSPNRARNRAITNRERDLTMLRGALGAAAISPWLSSKKNNSIKRNCSFDSCAIAFSHALFQLERRDLGYRR